MVLFSLDLYIFLTKNKAFFIPILQFRSHWNCCHFHFKSTIFLKMKISSEKDFPENPLSVSFSHYRCRIIMFQDLWPAHFMRTKTQNCRCSGGVFYTHQFAELVPSLLDLGTLVRQSLPFFDFSAIQSPAFPDAFFMAAKPKSTYDGISLFDVWKFLKFRNIL